MPRMTDDARAALDRHAPKPLAPSAHLTADEKKLWRTFVAACAAGHLSERDRPLVESWVTLTLAARKLGEVVTAATGAALADRQSGAARAMDKAATLATTLAGISNRLKIAPLATHSAPHKAAARKAPPQGEAPRLGLVGRK